MKLKFKLNRLNRSLQRGFLLLRSGKRRGFRGNSGAGGGGGGTSPASFDLANFRAGLNLAGMNEFSAYWPFINRIKCIGDQVWNYSLGGSGVVSGGTLDFTTQEPRFLANGQRCDLLVWNNLEAKRGSNLVKTGVWKFTWTGATAEAGLIVDVVALNGGVSGVSSTGNQMTFTVGAGCTNLYIRVYNTTGVTNGVYRISLFHTDYEAAYNSGEIFDPDFVASIQAYPYLKFLRFLDILSTNFSTVISSTDWTSLDHQSWSRSGKGVPPEVIGKFAEKFSCDIWVPAPYQATDSCLNTLYTKIFAQRSPGAIWRIWVEGINEFWNGQFPGANWCANTGSAGLTIVADGGGAGNAIAGSNDRWGCGYAHHAMRCWTQAEAVFGTSLVIRVAGLQTGNPGAFQNVWYYKDTSGTPLYGGAEFRTLLTSSHVLAMSCYVADYDDYGSTNPFSGRTQKSLIVGDWGSKSEATLQADTIAEINWIRDNRMIPYVQNARTRGVNARVEMYEGNDHTFLDAHDSITNHPAYFPITNTTTYAEFVNAADIGNHTNGDLYSSQQAIAPSPHNGSTLYYTRRIPSTNRLRLYSSLTNYNSDSGNTGLNSVTLNAGSYLNFCNRTVFARYSDKKNAIYQGATGLAIYQHFVTNVLLNANINCRSFGLFAHTNSSRNGLTRFIDTFANTNANGGMTAADTPLIDYLQSLNIAP